MYRTDQGGVSADVIFIMACIGLMVTGASYLLGPIDIDAQVQVNESRLASSYSFDHDLNMSGRIDNRVSVACNCSNTQGSIAIKAASRHRVAVEKTGDTVSIHDVDGIRRFTGHSMQPTIHTGYEVLVKDYEQGDDLSEGDIVIYSADGSDIGHRVVGVYPDRVVVSGDAVEQRQSVERSLIESVVVAVIHR